MEDLTELVVHWTSVPGVACTQGSQSTLASYMYFKVLVYRVLPSVVRISSLVLPVVPTSSMFRVARIEMGEKREFPVAGS